MIFSPKAKFFAKFFGESKKIIFSPFMQNYIFIAYRHAVWVLRYPQSIILTFSTQRCNLSGSLFFKLSIFLLFSSEKGLYLLRNQNQIVKCYITYTYYLSSNCLCPLCPSVPEKMAFKYFLKKILKKKVFFKKINFMKISWRPRVIIVNLISHTHLGSLEFKILS